MRKRLKVGDHVRFTFSGRDVVATVIEDRGPIGVQGRQILAVRLQGESGSEITIEMPAEELVAL